MSNIACRAVAAAVSVWLAGCVEERPKSEFLFATPQEKAAAGADVVADADADAADVLAVGADADAADAQAAAADVDAVAATAEIDAAADTSDAAAPTDVDVAAEVDAGPADIAAEVDSAADTPPVCSAAQCDDGNPCTDDACDAKAGCTKVANKVPCDAEGSVCSKDDTCSNGACLPGVTLNCDDGKACTDDSCDPKQGCKNVANSKACDADGSVCTQSDACSGGACVAGAKLTCSDGNVCTADSCDAKLGCQFPAVAEGAACDDGNGCTTGDKCTAGKCGGVGKSCDDGNPCTADSCANNVCSNANTTLACDDGSNCTQSDVCDGKGACAGKTVVCNDGNPCTDDVCVKGQGCVKTNNTATCDDGQVCTVGDACAGGACKAGPVKDCDDKNVCTTDLCAFGQGCANLPNSATCSDGNACTAGDGCGGGACGAGGKVNCDDGNACTTESCDTLQGCVVVNNTTDCSDGNACTVGDKCAGGGCKSGAAKDCDDGNICTESVCVNPKGCVHNNSGPGVGCEDGNSCTVADSCVGGNCVAGASIVWTHKIGFTGETYIVPFVVSVDPFGIIAVVSPGWPSTQDGQVDVVRLSNAGTLVWKTSLQKQGTLFFGQKNVSAAFVGDGYVVSCRYCKDGSCSPYSIWLAKINLAGAVIWTKEFKTSTGQLLSEAYVTAIEAGLLLSGSKHVWSNDFSKYEGFAYIAGLAADGSLLWDKSFANDGKGSWVDIERPALLDGDVVQLVRYESGKSQAMRISSSGTVSWVTSTGDLVAVQYDAEQKLLYAAGQATQIAITPVGGIAWSNEGAYQLYDLAPRPPGLLLSHQSKAGGTVFPALSAYDSYGNLVWNTSYQNTAWGYGDGNDAMPIAVTKGGYVVASPGQAAFLNGYSYGILVQRTDYWGHSTCANSGPCAAKNLADCADANPCTADLCDAAHNGCYHTNLPDGSKCGQGGICAAGSCKPNAVGCTNDGGTCGSGKGKCTSGQCQYTDGQGYKWTLVPPGVFWMGCNPVVDGVCSGNANENPQHQVDLSAYWIGVYEVTADIYKKCVTAGASGCTMPSKTGGSEYSTYGTTGKEQHPVNYVNWAQSQALCKWLGGDLPTEAQWEKAARGGCEVYAGKDCKASAVKYPWGNVEPVCGTHAVFNKDPGTCGAGSYTTYAVSTGSAQGVSPYGAYDMAGNVWEWTMDWYDSGFYSKPAATVKDAWNSSSASSRVVRGESFDGNATYLRMSVRDYGTPSLASNNIGARCSRSYP